LNDRILILGGSGMLGQALQYVLQNKGAMAIPLNRSSCDITKPADIEKQLKDQQPQLVINCAAYTKVDLAESEEQEAYAINAQGAKNVAKLSFKHAIPLIHISTDYVFDGSSEDIYKESALCNPLSVYGKSKRIGEEYILKINPTAKIVRTQWLYGPGGGNFVQTMLRLSQSHSSLSVVSDQIGSPTYTRHLALALYELSHSRSSGIFHIRSSNFASWFQFAQQIFSLCGISIDLHAIPTENFPRPAPRPKNARLAMSRWIEELQNPPLPNWQEGLKEYLSLQE